MRNRRKINYKQRSLRTQECDRIFDWKNAVPDKCAPFNKRTFIGLVNSSKFHYNTAKENEAFDYCYKQSSAFGGSANQEDFNQNMKKCAQATVSRHKYATSMLNNDNDLRSPKNLLNIQKAINCKIHQMSRKLQIDVFNDVNNDKVSFFKFNSLFF